jgi:type IV pilus assembly protein PilQ
MGNQTRRQIARVLIVATAFGMAWHVNAADTVITKQLVEAIAQPTTAPTAPPENELSELLPDHAPAASGARADTGSSTPLTAENVNVNDSGLVEIHVNDANLGEVLRMLSMQLERNILASREVRGTVTANLYDVTVRDALEAILAANDCAYREKGNVIYVYSKKELELIQDSERKTITETFRVYYTPAANAVNMIKPVLSSKAVVSLTTPAISGIEGGGKDVGGNSHADVDTIVITDYPDRLEEVRKVLKEIDRRPQQILVEAVILRASLNETNELGIDFSVLGGVDFSNLAGAVGGGIGGEAVPGALADKGFGAVQAGGSGLKVGVVTNNVSVFINALEGVTDTAVVANPKVLVLNKQKGEVHVGARLGYRTAVSTETLTADDVKFLEIGTRLAFRPYIDDSGYIRMEIKPSDSSGSVSTQGLPNEFVTEVTTNVIVKDGRTIVIGGLFRESNDTTRSQVPGLGNLPLAGPLFRKQKDQTIREEVIILLTPHIVKDQDAYADVSEAEQRHIERLRVGVRRGMMPWGRERLAESAYENAVKEMAKPNPNRKMALWHLDCATNLNPKFNEAITLKAQVRGADVTSVDNSTIRGFIQRLALADRERTPTTKPSVVARAKPQAAVVKKPAPAATKVVKAPTTKPAVATKAATTKPAVAAKPAAAPKTIAKKPTTRPTAAVVGVDTTTAIEK